MSRPQWGDSFINPDALGASIGLSWSDKRSWMHRRVDTVEFCDATTLRVQVSIDLTIPGSATPIINGKPIVEITGIGHGRVRLLPIALINKKEISMSFNLIDEEGRSLSRLGAKEAGILGAASLSLLARGVLAENGYDIPDMRRLKRWLSELCGPDSIKDPSKAWAALLGREWGMAQESKELLSKDSDFRSWSHMLAEYNFLCVLLEGDPGQARVIKYCYEANTSDSARGKGFKRSSRDLPARLGWKDTGYIVEAAAGNCASYHCEIIHPSGIDVKGTEMWEGPLDDPRVRPGRVAFRRGRNSLRSHVVTTRATDPFGKYHVEVRFRVSRGGWLGLAALLGFGISLLMFLSGLFFSAPESGATRSPVADPGTLVGTLLLAVGAACIAVLVRANEHQLTSHLLKYFRVIMTGLVVLAFLIVLALAFADLAVLKAAFLAAGAISLIGTMILAVPWLQHALDRGRSVISSMMRSFWGD